MSLNACINMAMKENGKYTHMYGLSLSNLITHNKMIYYPLFWKICTDLKKKKAVPRAPAPPRPAAAAGHQKKSCSLSGFPDKNWSSNRNNLSKTTANKEFTYATVSKIQKRHIQN